jgi:predicted secreted protein with PEFG-CTERM motif
VRTRIICSIAALLIISTGTVFAQESLISVQTDDKIYDEGDTIVISGHVTTIVGNTPATLQLLSNDNLIEIAQITIAQDGSYSHTIIAEGQQWKTQGDYTVRVSYGEGNTAESEFTYSPKSAVIKKTTIFEVDAGSHGTFDVKYTIKGATIKDIMVNSDIFGLTVLIESVDEGVITLELPREFIGAEKQDKKDDIFIILIDGIEVEYEEKTVHSESRIITINFEPNDSKIEIIGTYVVPEFGPIAVMILIVGITSIIILTKNKFQTSI